MFYDFFSLILVCFSYCYMIQYFFCKITKESVVRCKDCFGFDDCLDLECDDLLLFKYGDSLNMYDCCFLYDYDICDCFLDVDLYELYELLILVLL